MAPYCSSTSFAGFSVEMVKEWNNEGFEDMHIWIFMDILYELKMYYYEYIV